MKQYTRWLVGIWLSLLVFAPLFLSFSAQRAMAQTQKSAPSDCALFPGWSGCEDGQEIKGIVSDAGDEHFILEIIEGITGVLMRVAIPVIMLGILLMGYRFMAGTTNEEETTRAKEYLLYLFVGVGIIIIAYSVVQIIFNFLTL